MMPNTGTLGRAVIPANSSEKLEYNRAKSQKEKRIAKTKSQGRDSDYDTFDRLLGLAPQQSPKRKSGKTSIQTRPDLDAPSMSDEEFQELEAQFSKKTGGMFVGKDKSAPLSLLKAKSRYMTPELEAARREALKDVMADYALPKPKPVSNNPAMAKKPTRPGFEPNVPTYSRPNPGQVNRALPQTEPDLASRPSRTIKQMKDSLRIANLDESGSETMAERNARLARNRIPSQADMIQQELSQEEIEEMLKSRMKARNTIQSDEPQATVLSKPKFPQKPAPSSAPKKMDELQKDLSKVNGKESIENELPQEILAPSPKRPSPKPSASENSEPFQNIPANLEIPSSPGTLPQETEDSKSYSNPEKIRDAIPAEVPETILQVEDRARRKAETISLQSPEANLAPQKPQNQAERPIWQDPNESPKQNEIATKISPPIQQDLAENVHSKKGNVQSESQLPVSDIQKPESNSTTIPDVQNPNLDVQKLEEKLEEEPSKIEGQKREEKENFEAQLRRPKIRQSIDLEDDSDLKSESLRTSKSVQSDHSKLQRSNSISSSGVVNKSQSKETSEAVFDESDKNTPALEEKPQEHFGTSAEFILETSSDLGENPTLPELKGKPSFVRQTSLEDESRRDQKEALANHHLPTRLLERYKRMVELLHSQDPVDMEVTQKTSAGCNLYDPVSGVKAFLPFIRQVNEEPNVNSVTNETDTQNSEKPLVKRQRPWADKIEVGQTRPVYIRSILARGRMNSEIAARNRPGVLAELGDTGVPWTYLSVLVSKAPNKPYSLASACVRQEFDEDEEVCTAIRRLMGQEVKGIVLLNCTGGSLLEVPLKLQSGSIQEVIVFIPSDKYGPDVLAPELGSEITVRIFSVLSSGKLIRASLQLSETDEEEAESTIVDELEEGKLVEEELQNRGFQTKLDPVQRVHGFYMSFTALLGATSLLDNNHFKSELRLRKGFAQQNLELSGQIPESASQSLEEANKYIKEIATAVTYKVLSKQNKNA